MMAIRATPQHAKNLQIKARRHKEILTINRLIVPLLTDITTQKAHQRQLEHIAHHDALTNLPNRVLLAARLHEAMEEARRRGLRLVLGYLDLDGFKAVNDAHGHEVGDQLLVVVAGRMKEILRQADQAMYQAKLAGKNCYHVFDTERDRSTRGRHGSLEDIRRALTGLEFILRYQPKVNMRTGRVIGAEALIRWQHPDNGFLPPSRFLPVIEDHWLATKLGEWVIDTALTQLEIWHRTTDVGGRPTALDRHLAS